jgi:dihydroorotase
MTEGEGAQRERAARSEREGAQRERVARSEREGSQRERAARSEREGSQRERVARSEREGSQRERVARSEREGSQRERADLTARLFLLRGVRPYHEQPVDLLLDGGVIAQVGRRLAAPAGAHVVDAAGLVALPGLVDLHTHLREPGREDAETVETGSRAAALGGYAAVHAMANTDPVADTAGVVEQVWRLGRQAGLVDVQPVGAVTVGLAGEQLAELGAMADSPARVRVFSDDGHCVADPALMRRALEYVKAFDGVIAQHAEEPRLTAGAQMNEGVVSARLGLAGWPAAAEEAVIARDVLLCGHVGSRLHVCHVSTAGSVEILRWAKSKGFRVTAEVTPHHLLLTDELAANYDPVYKVNPPLRTAEDVAALRQGLADGVIDVVATDHAPHALEDKETEWGAARPGMLGLQTALSVLVETMIRPGRLTWRQLAERMSKTPARIGRLDGHGRELAEGEPANLALVDPDARWVVDPAELASRSRNTPYAGRTLPARVVATFLRGEPTVLDGKAVR